MHLHNTVVELMLLLLLYILRSISYASPCYLRGHSCHEILEQFSWRHVSSLNNTLQS